MSIAWSFPKTQKLSKKKGNRGRGLGPGAYDPLLDPYKKRNPSWSMGGRYKKKNRHKNPGPGTYQHQTHGKSAPKYSIAGKYEEKKTSNFFTPGPGTYSQDKMKKSLKYSMRIKPSARKNKNPSPGPANYNLTDPERFKDSAPKWTMGGSRIKQTNKNKTPGPGAYNNKSGLRDTGTFFGSSERKPDLHTGAPGPGTYEIKGIAKENLLHGKGKSLSSRHKLLRKDPTPAPTHYDPGLGIVKKSAPAFKFGGETRETKNRKMNNPAPDAYSPSYSPVKKNGPQWGIGTAPRPDLNRKNENPGPGTYDYQKNNERPHYTFGLKPDIGKDKEKVPGPGTYDPSMKLVQKSLEQGKIGTERRDQLSNRMNNSPGPGAYPNKSQLVKKGARIGTEKRKGLAKTNKAPGPGNYELKSIFEKSPNKGKSMGMKFKKKNRGLQLGPGSYNPKFSLSKKRATAAKVGTSKRKGLKSSKNPGPGQYNPYLGSSLPSWKIGSETRGRSKKNLNPGPGTYDMRSSKARKKPRFAMGIRLKDRMRFSTPGPGAYNPSFSLARQSKKLGGKINGGMGRRVTRSSQKPGPGQYNVSKALNKKGTRFGTGKRKFIKKSDTPGPGSYKLPPVIADVPHYSMPGGKKKIDYQ